MSLTLCWEKISAEVWCWIRQWNGVVLTMSIIVEFRLFFIEDIKTSRFSAIYKRWKIIRNCWTSGDSSHLFITSVRKLYRSIFVVDQKSKRKRKKNSKNFLLTVRRWFCHLNSEIVMTSNVDSTDNQNESNEKKMFIDSSRIDSDDRQSQKMMMKRKRLFNYL